jgi:hypothetical protein
LSPQKDGHFFEVSIVAAAKRAQPSIVVMIWDLLESDQTLIKQ